MLAQILNKSKFIKNNKGNIMKEYYQRISDIVLAEHLESKGTVLIEGPNL